MGRAEPPAGVLPLLAVISRHESAFVWAAARFVERFGPLALASLKFTFDQTDYYTPTMGRELRKQFLAPQKLRDPGELSGWKLLTNQWEEEFRASGQFAEPRPLNLDPGYISQDKLVLASTKNHAHRLYLGQGIYAEVTLQFRARRWQTCPWTYPDYGQAEYHAFFLACRDYLRQQRREGPEGVAPADPPA
jgi:hypothetical protein